MCGRYVMALRPSQVRQMLEDDGMPVEDAPADEGQQAPRQSYNFAPGYHGIVYRAHTPDWGAGSRHCSQGQDDAEDALSEPAEQAQRVTYKLQSMKWGLIPFWTKRNPDYGSMMKTINCRDDSLGKPGGLWATIKARKRCIVVAQGFFEWLQTGPKDKLPHYVKRRDGQLMCFAGLWDCVRYEDSDEKNYTYTIITTDSNKQLRFLHDRMPVVLNAGSNNLRKWLDPSKSEWTPELQALLRPFEGELDIYPVSKDVGKVGNSSPSFIIPIDSKENKSNIANFFANTPKEHCENHGTKADQRKAANLEHNGKGTSSQKFGSGPGRTLGEFSSGNKRKASSSDPHDGSKKQATSSAKSPSTRKISATRNDVKSANSSKAKGSQKITKFFANSA